MFLRRRRRPPEGLVIEREPDAAPKHGLFTEPVRVTDIDVLDPEVVEDGHRRVTFRVSIRDADGRRCPSLAVEARLTGPERTATVQGTTDMLGRLRFRMTGPGGTYRIEVTDVAAGGLDWDPDAGPATATIEVADA